MKNIFAWFLRINMAAHFLPLMLQLLKLVAMRVLSSDNKSTLAFKTGSLVKMLKTFFHIQSSCSRADAEIENRTLKIKNKLNLIDRIFRSSIITFCFCIATFNCLQGNNSNIKINTIIILIELKFGNKIKKTNTNMQILR